LTPREASAECRPTRYGRATCKREVPMNVDPKKLLALKVPSTGAAKVGGGEPPVAPVKR